MTPEAGIEVSRLLGVLTPTRLADEEDDAP